jgi:hypothetical protein
VQFLSGRGAARPILHAGLHLAGSGVEVSRQVESAGLTAEAPSPPG